MIPSLNLDDRTYQDIVNEAMRLIPHYTSEWTNHNPSDPGMTLVELFAWMTEMTIYRLNKVPEKTYLALIDLLGLSLVPPQASRVLLSFQPVEGYTGVVPVKAGFQVSAGKGTGEESVVFETEKDALISSCRVDVCFSTANRQVSERRVGVEPFALFGGAHEVDRHIYLAPSFGELLKGNNAVSVTFDAVQPIRTASDELANFITWEYWDGAQWVPVEAHGAISREVKQDNRVFIEGPLDIAATTVEGVEAFWLRGSLDRMPEETRCFELSKVWVNLHFLGEGVNPDACLGNTGNMDFEKIDLNRDFTPFLGTPKHNDVFYVSCEEILSKERARVSLLFLLSDEAETPSPNPSMVLRYEYWNGMDWVPMGQSNLVADVFDEGEYGFSDSTRGLSRSGVVSFNRPEDFSRADVGGAEAWWVRIRLTAGDFGKGGSYVEDKNGNWNWLFEEPVHAPLLSRIRLSYAAPQQPPTNLVTYDNFAYRDLTPWVESESDPLSVFEIQSDSRPITYFGFEQTLSQGSLYFRVDEGKKIKPGSGFFDDGMVTTSRAARNLGLVWEYWTGKRWTKLSVNDFTDGFHQSGFVDFEIPEDFSRKVEFGKTLYWLRVVFQSGSFEHAPVIEHVLTNAVYAWNRRTFREELIGSSSGRPDQRFELLRRPILSGMELIVREDSLPPANERAVIVAEEGPEAIRKDRGQDGRVWVRYHEVDNFHSSGPQSRHYVVDYQNNLVFFGNGVKGLIPPRGKNNLRAEILQVGGGLRGNVGAHAIRTLRESVPFLAGCDNPYPAEGGSDLESLDSLKHRASGLFKSLNRAVTAEDYEWLAREASASVARAKCLQRSGPKGEVLLVVVPEGEPDDEELIAPPVPTAELRRRVKEFLDPRTLVGTALRVDAPVYRRFDIGLKLAYDRNVVEFQSVRGDIERALRRTFHPLAGGEDGVGWAFGSPVQKDDVARVVEQVDGVHHVEELNLTDLDSELGVERLVLAEGNLPFVEQVRIEDRKVSF